MEQSIPTMISVSRTSIPVYLHNSEVFRSLQSGDEETILLPCDCMKPNDAVFTKEDLRSLLLTLRFWGADGYMCESVLVYVFSQPYESYKDIVSEFCDDFPALKYIESLVTSQKPLIGAIKSGNLELTRYFHKRGHTWPKYACDKIIRAGNTAMLEYALQAGCKVPELACKVAASNGHLECLRLLHANGAPWDEFTSATAARHGHLDCLKYAHENGCRWFRADQPHDFDFGFNHVYASSSEEEDNRYEDDSDDDLEGDDGWEGKLKRDICIFAAFNGQLECLKYAHEQGVPLTQRVLKAAARHPNGLECLKYAHQQGLRLTHPLCVTAVANQNIDMLKYLHESGCCSDSRAYTGALQCTTFECLKFLNENGCPWDSQVCRMAAMHGAGDMVLYLLQHGCPPDNYIWLLPDEYFDRVLDCFVEQGWSWEVTPQASVYVAMSGNLDHMERLIEEECLWHPQTTLKCINNVAMLQLVDDFDCPWHEDTFEKAALNGSLECLKYAYSGGEPLPEGICERLTAAIGSSVNPQAKECLEFVNQHYNGN